MNEIRTKCSEAKETETTVSLGVGWEIPMHTQIDFIENWKILEGVGIISFIEKDGSGAKHNFRLSEGNVWEIVPGDAYGVINVGQNELIIEVTKTPNL